MEEMRHQIFVPVPGIGHLVATVELAKHILLLCNHLTITILVIPPLFPNSHVSSSISTDSASVPNLSFLHLQPITFSHPPNIRKQLVASMAIDLYKPSIKSAIQTLLSSSTAPITALVLDFFYSDLVDVGLELGIPPYIFFTSSAAMLAIMLHIPTLGPSIPNNIKAIETKEKVPFPGFSSMLPLSALPDEFAHGKDEVYGLFLRFGLNFRKAKGILVNTFVELQPDVVKALEEGLYIPDNPTPPVYHVGPLLSFRSAETGHACIRWLDEQPHGSVVFLCFGSMGSFPVTQVKEVALGLERSGHRFLWVLKDEGLPEGFLERTRGRGLVWPSFAPQKEILGHVAVGGFVTHCGWNSCLESLWFGVPMAAWPLYAEQHLNAYEMVEEMGVAEEVRIDRLGGNRATAEEVERVVRLLMGDGSAAVRKKVREMKERARKAVEEGGSSYRALEIVVGELAGGVRTQ